jgi:hypothetical protein
MPIWPSQKRERKCIFCQELSINSRLTAGMSGTVFCKFNLGSLIGQKLGGIVTSGKYRVDKIAMRMEAFDTTT